MDITINNFEKFVDTVAILNNFTDICNFIFCNKTDDENAYMKILSMNTEKTELMMIKICEFKDFNCPVEQYKFNIIVKELLKVLTNILLDYTTTNSIVKIIINDNGKGIINIVHIVTQDNSVFKKEYEIKNCNNGIKLNLKSMDFNYCLKINGEVYEDLCDKMKNCKNITIESRNRNIFFSSKNDDNVKLEYTNNKIKLHDDKRFIKVKMNMEYLNLINKIINKKSKVKFSFEINRPHVIMYIIDTNHSLILCTNPIDDSDIIFEN